MTTGSGISLNPGETVLQKIVFVINQILQGRSNAVGTATLTHDGIATTTAITAVNCGPNSAVFLYPTTAHAAAVGATTFVSSVGMGTFTITHATTTNADCTFSFAAFG